MLRKQEDFRKFLVRFLRTFPIYLVTGGETKRSPPPSFIAAQRSKEPTMLKSRKVMLIAVVALSIFAGAAGQKQANAGISIACGPNGCQTTYTTPNYRYSPTYFVRFFDPRSGWRTNWYKNYNEAVGAVNYLRYNGYTYNYWTR
jgi:hypothetical protein